MPKLRLVLSACAVAACLTTQIGCSTMLFQPHRWHELNSGPALGNGNFSVPDDFTQPTALNENSSSAMTLDVPLPE